MLLDARDSNDCLMGRAPALRYAFNAASAEDMKSLGAAFAHVVREHAESATPALRIGLAARPGTGKTTFIRGLMGTMPDKREVENIPYAVSEDQGLWEIPQVGFVRHYDAGFALRENCLKSYWDNDTAHCAKRVDIIEHPECDRNDKNYHYLLVMEYADRGETRLVTVMSSPELPQTEGFKKFLEDAQPYKAPYDATRERLRAHNASSLIRR